MHQSDDMIRPRSVVLSRRQTQKAGKVHLLPLPLPLPLRSPSNAHSAASRAAGEDVQQQQQKRKQKQKQQQQQSAEVEGTLLLRIQGGVYEAEYPLIQSIAYPTRGGSGSNNNSPTTTTNTIAGSTMEATRKGAAALSRESDDPSVLAERGGARGGRSHGDRLEGEPAHGGVVKDTDLRDVFENAVSGIQNNSGGDVPTASRRGREEGAGNRGGDVSTRADGGGGSGCKGRDEMDGRRGPAEAQDTDLGAAPAHTTARHTARDSIPGDGGARTTTADDCPRNNRRPHSRNDPLPAPTTKKRKLDCDDGDGDAPFCGLMFPGVLLKFWVRHEHGLWPC